MLTISLVDWFTFLMIINDDHHFLLSLSLFFADCTMIKMTLFKVNHINLALKRFEGQKVKQDNLLAILWKKTILSQKYMAWLNAVYLCMCFIFYFLHLLLHFYSHLKEVEERRITYEKEKLFFKGKNILSSLFVFSLV